MSYNSVYGRIPVVYSCGCLKLENSPSAVDPAGELVGMYDGEKPVNMRFACYACKFLLELVKKEGIS